MSTFAHQVALVVAVAALGAASLRVASGWVPRGLDRVIAAAATACSAAVATALALGVADLGAHPVALTAAAVLVWLAARRLAPAPELGAREELGSWWRGLRPAGRAAAGATAAALTWWVVWIFLSPPIGFDASLYQYVEVARWVQSGTPGAVERVSYEFPVGNYPLTTEVLLAWGAGISRSFVPLTLVPPASFVLLVAAGIQLMRRLGAPPVLGALAVVAVATVPELVGQVAEPDTDLQALAWLAATAALAMGAREHPRLLAPALLAAALAVGSKTTVGPLAAAALVIGWRGTGGRIAWRWLAPFAVAAVVVGGVWYLRNLITHGTPFWPFAPGPFGDPTPRWLATVDTSFLDRPVETVRQVEPREYAKAVGAGLVLVPAALLAPLAARRREVLTAALLTFVALLLWMNAPATGIPDAPGIWAREGWPASTTRYLMPVLGMASVTLALAAGAAGRVRSAAAVVLALVTVGNLIVVIDVADPLVPPDRLLVAALAGALVTRLAGAARWPGPRVSPGAPARVGVWSAGAAALVAALALAADGFVERHARVGQSSAIGLEVVEWFASRPGFSDGDEPIHTASRAMIGPLAGDRLQHPLELIPRTEPCPRVLARTGWVVASESEFAKGFLGIEPLTSSRCLAGKRRLFTDGNFHVYRLR